MFKLFRQKVPKLDIKIMKREKIYNIEPAKEITNFKPEYENIVNQLEGLCLKYKRRSVNSLQVGMKGRIALIAMPVDYDNSSERETTAYFNPIILNKEGLQYSYETSSERPDVIAKKYRPYKITVQAQNYKGDIFTKTLEGIEAILLCHEIDSLDGIVFTEDAEDPSFAMTPDEKKEYKSKHPQTIINTQGNYDEQVKEFTNSRIR